MRPVYEKFTNGEPLTDSEIEEGISFFYDMTLKLSAMGPVFRLAANESNRVLIQLQNFRDARKESTK